MSEHDSVSMDPKLVRRVIELEDAIRQAINHAGGHELEWGERAEHCFEILEQALTPSPDAEKAASPDSEVPKGLYNRYIDKDARYFVLRYDWGGDDIKHIAACRDALRVYCDHLDRMRHLPELVKDLRAILGSDAEKAAVEVPATEPFKVGDWLVCVDDGSRLYKDIFQAEKIDADTGHIFRLDVWLAPYQLRHATPAEVEAHLKAAWIEWGGGDDIDDSPVNGMVDVKQRNGVISLCVEADDMDWCHMDNEGDIIAYRVVDGEAREGVRDE